MTMILKTLVHRYTLYSNITCRPSWFATANQTKIQSNSGKSNAM